MQQSLKHMTAKKEPPITSCYGISGPLYIKLIIF